MITYVNTVLVGTGVGTVLSAMPEKNASKSTVDANIGKYIVTDVNGTALTSSTADDTQAIKVGLVTGSFYSKGYYFPKIKWSNISIQSILQSLRMLLQSTSQRLLQLLQHRQSVLLFVLLSRTSQHVSASGQSLMR